MCFLCLMWSISFAQQGAKVVLTPHHDPGYNEKLELVRVMNDVSSKTGNKYDSTYAIINVKWMKETASKHYVEWQFERYDRDTAGMDEKDKVSIYATKRFTELSPIVITIRKLDGVVGIDNQADIDSVSKIIEEEVKRMSAKINAEADKETKELLEGMVGFMVETYFRKEIVKPIEIYYGIYNMEDTITLGVKQDIKTLGKNNKSLGDFGAFSPKGYRLLDKTTKGDYKLTMDLDVDMSEMMAMFAGMAKSMGGDVKVDNNAKNEMEFKGLYEIELDKQTNITSSLFKLSMKGEMMGDKGDKKEWMRIKKIA